jgi:peroxiredoxin
LSFDHPGSTPLITKPKNGVFIISDEISEPYEHVYLLVKKNDEHIAGWNFFITKGSMKVDILSINPPFTSDSIRFHNIPFTLEQNRYDLLVKQLKDSLNFAANVLYNVRIGLFKQFKADSVVNAIRYLKNERLARQISFIKSISETYLGLYLFNKEVLTSINGIHISPDSLMAIYSEFSTSVKETNLGRSVYTYIIKKRALLINEIMPDFSFSASDGQRYQLSSFRNRKYVLMCFWDAGCGGCIENIPLLKRLNETYGKELQLISVSIDKSEDVWKRSLKKYSMPWLQTCDIAGYMTGPAVASLYDITYIPQYFLIDKEGRLIYHNTQLNDDLGYPALQKMLEKLMR